MVWSNQWEPSTKRQRQRGVWRAMGEFQPLQEDIATVSTTSIPDHDVLVGGFPCQDYSVATTLKNSKGLRGRKVCCGGKLSAPVFGKCGPTSEKSFFTARQTLPSCWRVLVTWDMLSNGESSAADYGMPQRRRRIFFWDTKERLSLRCSKGPRAAGFV